MRLSLRTLSRTLPFAFLTLVAFYFCIAAQEKQGEAHSIRVLFIGNSYTYFNNLPEIFTKLAQSGHQGKVETMMAAPGGWRLKDHWEKGDALKALHEGKWDYVVLQDQSTLGVDYFLEGKLHVTSDEVF